MEHAYTKSEIREKRRIMERRLGLEQQQLEALVRMDEAAEDYERATRELAELESGGTQLELSTETVHAEPEPHAIGERLKKILMDHAGTWLEPRDFLAEMDQRGWVDTDPGKAIQRVRHSLRRIAISNAQVERDETGMTYRYKWRRDLEGNAPIAVPQANGASYPALLRGAD